MKDRKHIAIFLVIGLIVLLIYLWYKDQEIIGPSPSGNVSGAPTYPNVGPINLGGIDVGSTPSYISYNNVPRPFTQAVAPDTSDNCNCNSNNDCSASLNNNMVVTNMVPPAVIETSKQNLNDFVVDTGSTKSTGFSSVGVAPTDAYAY